MTTSPENAELRAGCWQKSLHAFATSYIFETRYKKYGNRLRVIEFLGIAVPLAIGSIFLSFGPDVPKLLIVLAGILGVIQVVASAWSLVGNWADKYSYARESISANRQQSEDYRTLAENPDLSRIDVRYQVVEAVARTRDSLDDQQDITDEEKRRGHRAALRKFQKECLGCGKIPLSMNPSDCPVCGMFSRRVI